MFMKLGSSYIATWYRFNILRQLNILIVYILLLKMNVICNRVFVPLYRWSFINARHFTNASGPLFFRATSPLSAEPMKKKKKIDITIIVTREQRKMRKLEKAIRKQEMKGRTLKPVDEIEGDRSFFKDS